MPPPRFLRLLALGVLGLTTSTLHAGFGLFQNYWGNVIVSTDMTPEGRALTPPTPENPTYFLGRSLGARLGTIRGDQEPNAKEMTALVTRLLAKQGYVGAHDGHEPTLYLMLQWGYVDPRSEDLLWFLGYNAADDIGASTQIGFLGPEVFRRNMRSRVVEDILSSANDPIYGIIVTAFEYKSVNTDKPLIYWQTRIGLPANGKSMAEALPTMFYAAAPDIGRPSDKSVLRDADAAREGTVKLHDLKILDVVGGGKNK